MPLALSSLRHPHKQTKKTTQTVTNISTPYLSACVYNKDGHSINKATDPSKQFIFGPPGII